MTHAALINAALFFLVFLTLLLLMFIGAVMVAPSAPPRSGSPEAPAGETPAPPGLEAPMPPPTHVAVPSAPLSRRRPLTTATAAGTTRWSDAGAATDGPPPVYNEVRRPKVSGSPPWGPVRKPPGPDPWAAENPAPGWHQWPDEGPVSPPARRPTSSTPPPGRPAPAGTQARHARHGLGR